MIPRHLKAENKIFANITITYLVGAFAALVGGYAIGSLIFGGGLKSVGLVAIFVVVYTLLYLSSPTDKRKRGWNGYKDIFRFFTSPKTLYGDGSEEAKDRRHYDEVKK